MTKGQFEGIQTLQRAAQVLRAIQPGGVLNVTELSRELHVGRSTLHRYLATMDRVGFLERSQGGSYSLGPLMAQLGVQALTTVQIVQIASATMNRLSEAADETVVLSIWGGGGAVVSRVAQPDKLINVNVRTGTVLPEQAAQTRVFLHHLHQEGRLPSGVFDQAPVDPERLGSYLEDGFLRQDGYMAGLTTIACPVFNSAGITATIALVGTTSGITENLLKPKSQHLIEGAQQLSEQLGATNSK